MRKTVIGIDPSSKTGVVVLDIVSGDVVYHGLLTSDRTGLSRARHLADQLCALLDQHEPANAVIEGYAYMNQFSIVTLVEIGTLFRLALLTRGIPTATMAPTSLKKFITGSGSAAKDKIMLEVFKRWNFSAPDNNIADAFGLAQVARSAMNPSGLLVYQRDAIAKLQKITCN